MPYERKDKCVYKKNTGKKVGCSKTKEKAKKYLKKLYTVESFQTYYESQNGYTVLYHIGENAPFPHPLRSYDDRHSRLKDYPYDTGVWLTDKPIKGFAAMEIELMWDLTRKKSRRFKKHFQKLPKVLNLWVVRVPTNIVNKLGGLRQNHNLKNVREIVIPREYWDQVKVEKSKQDVNSFKQQHHITNNTRTEPIQPDWLTYEEKVRKYIRNVALADISKMIKLLNEKQTIRFVDAVKTVLKLEMGKKWIHKSPSLIQKCKDILNKYG